MDFGTEFYRKIRNKGGILFAHCAHCLKDKPAGQSPAEWQRLESFIYPMENNRQALIIGCMRCEMPIAAGYIDMPIEQCKCDECKQQREDVAGSC